MRQPLPASPLLRGGKAGFFCIPDSAHKTHKAGNLTDRLIRELRNPEYQPAILPADALNIAKHFMQLRVSRPTRIDQWHS